MISIPSYNKDQSICMYVLQVILFLRSIHPNKVNLSQPRSICFKLDQLLSTLVNLFQPRSVWRRQTTKFKGQKLQVIVLYQYRNNPKSYCLQMLILGLKNFCLGLRLAVMNVYDNSCIQQTMTFDLWPVNRVSYLPQTDLG